MQEGLNANRSILLRPGTRVWHHWHMQGVQHYENFPVASWLCPPHLRAPITALYRFARTADDLADEGDATAQERLHTLAAYRAALDQTMQGRPTADSRWSGVFGPLQAALRQHALPSQPLHDLLDAFEQDVRYTEQGHRYATEDELLDYCRRSANPVGRLLLHLYGVTDATSLRQSDAICSALQLINFWQDLSVDLPRHRCYLPLSQCSQHGVELRDLDQRLLYTAPKQTQPLVAELVQQARALMLSGAPLALRLPGRAGWELRLVVQGGLRMADKIDRLGERIWQERPRLGAADGPLLLWRACRMPQA